MGIKVLESFRETIEVIAKKKKKNAIRSTYLIMDKEDTNLHCKNSFRFSNTLSIF